MEAKIRYDAYKGEAGIENWAYYCSFCNACVEDYSVLFLYCHVSKELYGLEAPWELEVTI